MALIIPPNTSSPSLDGQQAVGQSARAVGKPAVSSTTTASESSPRPGNQLAVSDALRVQIRSLATSERNANDGISMVQTADVALDKMGGLLERMRDLAETGASDETAGDDLEQGRAEFSALRDAASQIRKGATYEGHSLLGPTEEHVGFDVGSGDGESERITVTLGGLELFGALGATTHPSAAPAYGTPSMVGRLDDALSAISNQRARFGATVNRFSEATSMVQTARAGRTAIAKPLESADAAEDLANMIKAQMFDKPASAVQAQAQPLSKHLLSLLSD